MQLLFSVRKSFVYSDLYFVIQIYFSGASQVNFFLFCSANLSHDYFVNRQDRYMLFRDCKKLANFFSDVISITMAHSYTLDSQGSTQPPSAISFDPLSSVETANAFKISLRQAMTRLTQPTSEHLDLSSELDTIVYPLLQMGFCGIRQDETATQRLLSGLGEGEELYLSSGYFNLPPTYSRAILHSQGSCNILAASPQVSPSLTVAFVCMLSIY